MDEQEQPNIIVNSDPATLQSLQIQPREVYTARIPNTATLEEVIRFLNGLGITVTYGNKEQTEEQAKVHFGQTASWFSWQLPPDE